MTGDYDHLKSRIKPAVFNYIKDYGKVAEKNDIEPPHELIYFVRNKSPTGEFAHRSSETTLRLPRPFKSRLLAKKHFQEIADWLEENDEGFPIPYFADTDPDAEERKKSYIGLLSKLAKSTIDYQYGIEYNPHNRLAFDLIDPYAGFYPSDEAFDKAFETEVNERFKETQTWSVVVVLESFNMNGAELNIGHPNKEWEHREFKTTLDSEISIRELEKSEKAGIVTYISEEDTRFSKDDYPTLPGQEHKIGFDLTVDDRSHEVTSRDRSGSKNKALDVAEEIAEDVVTGLRLFKPAEALFIRSIYLNRKNWHSETLGVKNVDKGRLLSYRSRPTLFDINTIYKLEKDIFESFWESNQTEICDEDHPLSKGLHRFNQAYDESNREDIILDVFIGFESTLLKEIDSQYALKFPLRMILLLRDSTYYTNEYLDEAADNLREMRNRVVHSDDKIESKIESMKDTGELNHMIGSESDISPYEFQTQVLQLFAEALIRYMELTEKHGTGVGEINKEGLDPAMDEMLMTPVDFEKHL